MADNSSVGIDRMVATAQALFGGDKGLLAMDESNGTCNKRFARWGIPQTPECRRAYRELIITTPRLGESIGGAILYDETIRQGTKDGTSFVAALVESGIVPGIKVDLGAKSLAGHTGEKATDGLDGLRGRLKEYSQLGARFAKWRGVLTIGDGIRRAGEAVARREQSEIPSRACIDANCHALARYAALCQEASLLPIVEPEVLMDGNHSMAECLAATEEVLRALFEQLYRQRVALEALILKPNMVLAGLRSPLQPTVDEVADATVDCLLRTVPAAVPAIAFLSGGQSPELASARLNAMNQRFRGRLPWALSFSFSRAIQEPALAIWQGREAEASAAQGALYHRATCNRAARRGEYGPAMERGKCAPMPETKPLRLYLIRHGETEWSLSGQHTGSSDIALTARGEDEARELGQALQDISFDHGFTSPRQRARRTSELVEPGLAVQVEPDLAEWDYGEYEGRLSADIGASWSLFRDGCPHGESPAQVLARVDRLLARLRTLDGNVALFSHGQFGAVLAARWIGLPLVEAEHFPLGTASLAILCYANHHPDVSVIEQWNGRTEARPARRVPPKAIHEIKSPVA